MAKKNIEIGFLGDISLNNRYTKRVLQQPFSGVQEDLSAFDYVVGNLEALSNGEDGFNLKKKPYLYADFEALSLLNGLQLDLVSTAHNHVYDTFDSGYLKTRDFLKDNNIASVGSSFASSIDLPYLTEIEGKRFAFLNYCHPDTNFAKPDNTSIHLQVYDAEKIVADIQTYKKQVDYLVLLLHWGGKADYGFIPTMDQVQDAKRFIDMGADAIVGHHAHCIQPLVYYKGKPIFYCLGNFCFDDIVSHGNTFLIRNSGKRGLIGRIHFNSEKKRIKASYQGVINKNLEIKKASSLFALRMIAIKCAYYCYVYITPFRRVYAFYLKKIEPLVFYYQASEKSIWQKLRDLNMDKITFFLKKIIR